MTSDPRRVARAAKLTAVAGGAVGSLAGLGGGPGAGGPGGGGPGGGKGLPFSVNQIAVLAGVLVVENPDDPPFDGPPFDGPPGDDPPFDDERVGSTVRARQHHTTSAVCSTGVRSCDGRSATRSYRTAIRTTRPALT